MVLDDAVVWLSTTPIDRPPGRHRLESLVSHVMYWTYDGVSLLQQHSLHHEDCANWVHNHVYIVRRDDFKSMKSGLGQSKVYSAGCLVHSLQRCVALRVIIDAVIVCQNQSGCAFCSLVITKGTSQQHPVHEPWHFQSRARHLRRRSALERFLMYNSRPAWAEGHPGCKFFIHLLHIFFPTNLDYQHQNACF